MSEQFEEDQLLLEDSEYSRKSEFSKAIVCQTQVQKCLELRSKDMRPGYTTWILDKDGNAKPQIIPDSRKEFISAVEALKMLLNPEIKVKEKEKDENAIGLLSEYEKKKKESFEKYAFQDYKREVTRENDGSQKWIKVGQKYIPHKGARLGEEGKAGIWDSKVDGYWDEMVEAADILFSRLNDLIHSLEYFKGGFSL